MDTTTYSVRLPNDLHHRLKLHALNQRTHASEIVRAILEDALPPLPGPAPIDPAQTVIPFLTPPAPDPLALADAIPGARVVGVDDGHMACMNESFAVPLVRACTGVADRVA